MRSSILDLFDASLQKSQIWLNDLMRELDWQDKPQNACLALRAALHALRDRLTVEEAVHLGAQLPILIRGVYYEGWKLSGKPVKERHKSEFLDHIAAAFRDDATVDPEKVMRGFLKTLSRHISPGETQNVKHLLPMSLQELWPQ
jgi:uncharacterized protein (DUF2267 family)